MRKLVVYFSDENAVHILGKRGLVSYIPMFYKHLQFIFIETDLSDKTLLEIDGVTEVRETRKGTINI